MIWTAIAALWKPVAALLAVLGIYLAGRKDARQKAENAALHDYAETRKKADEADIVSEPDAAREWLRNRDKRDGPL